MKKAILFLLLYPLFSTAQRTEWDIAYKKSIPAGLGKPIRLPDPGYSPYFSLAAVAADNVKQRITVIASDSTYRKIFWRYRFTMDSVQKYAPDKNSWYHKWMIEHLRDSLPAIDFEKQELLMYSACGQCLAYCFQDGKLEPCHRNACGYSYSWFIKEKSAGD